MSTFGGRSVSGLGGAPTFSGHGGFWRSEFPVVPELLSVIAVIDLTRVAGLDWGQVTDYVVMASLTRVNLDAKTGDVTLWDGFLCSDTCHLTYDADNGPFVPDSASLWVLP